MHPSFGPLPMRFGAVGTGQHLGRLPSEIMYPARIKGSPAGITKIVHSQRHRFGLLAETQPLIPAPRKIQEVLERVAQRLQSRVVALDQARQSSLDRRPFGFQHRETLVFLIAVFQARA